ncbi:hypothetical protein KKC13_02165 [bacterium]|nr:hypothetical protein [bacterium]MBU1957681.1 hypothetical protein [bacterium]
MSHLNSIGFKVSSAEEFEALVAKVFELGVAIDVEEGTYIVYTDKSGAQIYAQVDSDDEFMGFLPAFDASSKRTVHLQESINHEDKTSLDLRCYAKSEENTYPFVFEVLNAKEKALTLPVTREIALVAFPHEIEYFATAAAFMEENPDLSTTYFIPVGLMNAEGEAIEVPEPYAMFVGEVKSVEVRTNELGGGEFYVLVLAALEGDITAVTAVETLAIKPKVGGFINGVFWISAKV